VPRRRRQLRQAVRAASAAQRRVAGPRGVPAECLRGVCPLWPQILGSKRGRGPHVPRVGSLANVVPRQHAGPTAPKDQQQQEHGGPPHRKKHQHFPYPPHPWRALVWCMHAQSAGHQRGTTAPATINCPGHSRPARPPLPGGRPPSRRRRPPR